MKIDGVKEKLKEAKLDADRTLQERIVYRFDASSDKALLLQDMLDLMDEVSINFPKIVEIEYTDWKELAFKQDTKLCTINNWFKKNFTGE
jgi:hypothetical protein